MRKLTISLFQRAADAHAQRKELTFEELVEEFRNPEIVEEPATESLAAEIKLSAMAWSPSCFRNDHRAKEDFISASILVYDLDEVQDLVGLLKLLKSLGCSYAVHSTTRSGFRPHKLRVIFPLAQDHNAVEYDALWGQIRGKLGVEPDPTRRHPSGLFFAPVVFAEHKASYVFECELLKPWLGGAKAFATSVAFHDEKYWLDTIRFATQKHEALNKAAFALAKLNTQEVVEKCLEALRTNTVSDPVEDWAAARRTAEKAVEDAALEIEDVSEQPFSAPQLTKTAEARLRAAVKNVAQGSSVRTAAFELGRFVPHAISADTVEQALLEAWGKQKRKQIDQAEAQVEITTGIAAGTQQPLGLHEGWKQVLFLNNEGTGFAGTESNTQLAISTHPEIQDLVAFDVRQDAAFYLKEAPWECGPGRIADGDKRKLGPWVARELGVNNVSSAVAFDALLSKAADNIHDVLLDYFKALPSQYNTEILDRVLIECAGAEDTDYVRLATRYWFTSVYARQVEPGCQVDHALILSGLQGVGKSTFFKTIFPKDITSLCSTDALPAWDDKDCKILLSRFAVIELSELDQMSRATIEAVKKFLTERQAEIRPSYGRVSRPYPRRAVFGGTTNKECDFLVDPTGNRRFWPVFVREFDYTWNDKYRDLVWAQARYVYETTKRWWPSAEEKALFTKAAEHVVAAETFQDDLAALLSQPASSKVWKTRGATHTDGMAVLEEGQELGKPLPFVLTKQVALILGLDYNNPGHSARIKRGMKLEGWKEIKRDGKRIWINGKQ